MKKIKYLGILLIGLFIGILPVYAASFSVKGTTSETTVGGSVSVTVNVSGAAGWEYCLNYDSNVFSLSSAGSDTGGNCVKTGSTLTGYASVTYKFQAVKSGSGTFSVTGQAYDDDGNAIESSAGSVSVNVKTKEEIEASLSTNNYLKILEVEGYELTPAFNKNTTEYTLSVDGDVETVTVNAYREDGTASITPIDKVNLTEGVNKVRVTVTAQKGNKRTYTITITKAESNPIKVKVDGKEYTVVTKANALELPVGYIASTTTIEGKEVPVYNSDTSKLSLIILKDEESNMAFFIYKDGKYTKFKQVNSTAITFIPGTPDKLMKGYEKKKNIKINDIEIEVYYKGDKDNVVLVYGMNDKTGENAWYFYDIKEGTLLKVPDSDSLATISGVSTKNLVDAVKVKNTDYKMIAIIFAGISAVSIFLNILLALINSRAKRKNQELLDYIEARMNKQKNKKFDAIADKEANTNLKDIEDFTKSDILDDEEEVKEESEEIEEESEEELSETDKIDLDDTKEEEVVEELDNTIDYEVEIEEDTKEIKTTKKEPTLINDEDILNNIAKANDASFDDEEEEKPKKKLTKKEEKEKKKKEKKLAKQAMKEFLDDKTFEESAFDTYEREETEVIPTTKKKTVRKKKK